MIERQRWFERKFNFDLPVWMSANVIARLRGTPARMEELLLSVSDDARTRRDGDRWAMQEHAGHLLDLEELGLGRLEDYAAGRERLRPADILNRKTYEANHNAQPIESILRAFRRERMELVARVEAMDEAAMSRTSLHPRLNQPMRVLDLLLFTAEHDDHHLASIAELAQKFAITSDAKPARDKANEWTRGDFTISTDASRLDLEIIRAFLDRSYWAKGRPLDVIRRSIENSMSFGIYKGAQQVGFARVITDRATFAWLADLFVLEEYRGQNLSKWLMETIIAHPDLQGLRRWTLATKDAHTLYRRYGFTELKRPERWMERHDPATEEQPDYFTGDDAAHDAAQ